MPITMGAISAGAGIAGGIAGNIASADDRRNARDKVSEAMGELMSIGLPPDLSQRLVLEKFKQEGTLTPAMEQEIQLQASKVGQIKEAPELKDAQLNALRMIQKRGQVGLTPEDRMAFNQLRQETQRDAEGKRQQIMQQMAARGQGGSGAELIAQLQAGQSGADRQSAEGDRIAAAASQNALQAMSQAGQLGGQIRGQDFSVNQARAGADDQNAMQQFNQAVSRQTRNVGNSNQAQQYNLGQAQDVSNRNVSQSNAETQRQNQAKMDYWNAMLGRAQMRSGALMGAANMANQQAQQKAGMWQSIGSGVGAGAGAMAGSGMFSGGGSSGGASSMGNQAGEPYNAYNAKPIV